jgi:hypothetical protein
MRICEWCITACHITANDAHHQSHRSFGWSLKGFNKNNEDMWWLQVRWYFNEDNNPIVACPGREGRDSAHRIIKQTFGGPNITKGASGTRARRFPSQQEGSTDGVRSPS